MYLVNNIAISTAQINKPSQNQPFVKKLSFVRNSILFPLKFVQSIFWKLNPKIQSLPVKVKFSNFLCFIV
ncbi:hypothetical protein VCRLGP7_880013 [Vibrio crassostreae]|nr:hypothetical protein VCRLGP107_270018 [Vibrio crassostreae]CDT62369.1 hypothetical protein VCRLGP7_880013 [Vibrio crassostreae]